MITYLHAFRIKILILLIQTLLIGLVSCSSPPDMRLTVGGKLDKEAQLLTEMYTLLLQKAGFKVTEKAALGNTFDNFNAIRNGAIDLYPEFTATGLNLLKIPSAHNPQQDYLNVKSGFDSRYKITWLTAAPLNDGYALCTSKDEAKLLGKTLISKLAPEVSNLVLASPGDGIPFVDELKSTYGFDTSSFKSVQKVDYKVGFTAVINNQAQVNVCYTTDGTVLQKNFLFFTDDLHGFPEFHPAPIVRDDVLQKYPGIANSLNPLAPKLTTEVSIMLQAEVNSGLSVSQVASTWLKSQGLL